MSKYYVKDDDGNDFLVEEVNGDPQMDKPNTNDNDFALSTEEVGSLKKLALVADKLVALVTPDDTPAATDADPSENKGEQVIDTNVTVPTKGQDSKSSFGSIENKKVVDSVDHQGSIADAWAKRYGGK